MECAELRATHFSRRAAPVLLVVLMFPRHETTICTLIRFEFSGNVSLGARVILFENGDCVEEDCCLHAK